MSNDDLVLQSPTGYPLAAKRQEGKSLLGSFFSGAFAQIWKVH